MKPVKITPKVRDSIQVTLTPVTRPKKKMENKNDNKKTT